MRRSHQEWTARLFRQIGLPTWILYTAVLHAWVVLIAAKISGLGAAVSTGITPVSSWLYWGLALLDPLSSVAHLLLASLMTWLFSTALVFTAWRVNRRSTPEICLLQQGRRLDSNRG